MSAWVIRAAGGYYTAVGNDGHYRWSQSMADASRFSSLVHIRAFFAERRFINARIVRLLPKALTHWPHSTAERRIRALKALGDALETAIGTALDDERRRIVGWLRSEAGNLPHGRARTTLRLAHAIERHEDKRPVSP